MGDRLDDIKFRFWLAVLSVIQFCSIFLDAFFPPMLLWIFLPFASTAIIFVFVAIFCKWKKGIYAFLLASLAMFICCAVSLVTIFTRGGVGLHNPHRLVIYIVQLVINAICIFYGASALMPSNDDSSRAEERRGFLG